MSQSLFSRLCATNIPWLQHISIVTSAIYLFPLLEIRAFLILYAVLAFLLDTEELLKAFQSPDEPPLIPHPYLPFLGHVIGMFWYGAKYFPMINERTQYPIFSLQTLTIRTYGVVDPACASVLQKKSKDLSFYDAIFEVSRRLVDWDEKAMSIITWNLHGEHGAHLGSLIHEGEGMITDFLSPGSTSLDKLSITQLDKFSELVDNMIPGSSRVEMSLMDFVRRTFTTANALAIYGPKNIFFMYPSLVQKFWDYEAGMIGVMADVLPYLTARKAWQARQALNAALLEWIEKDNWKTASEMIQRRISINLRHGLSPKMAAHSELILLFGILGNAVPTTFWTLANIFGRPELLAEIREETRRAVTVTARNEAGEPTEKKLDVTELKNKCGLLVSTYRESLRQIANLSSVRLVLNTHMIQVPGPNPHSYLLKKGNMIQMASGVIHTLESVWGPDAKVFNPERFLSQAPIPGPQDQQPSTNDVPVEKIPTALPKNVPSAAFRAFGGGSVICPGRHFALSEIVGFVALCIHMFDITDAKTGGTFELPVRDEGKIPLSVMKPVEEPRVVIKRREGEESVRWRLVL